MRVPPELFDDAAQRYDAVLVVSFGGPEGPDDVLPFLDNVLRGREVSAEAKTRVAQRYLQFGGASPINDHTRAFVQALEGALHGSGLRLPVYLGNRNWHPFLYDAVQQMAADGVRSAIAFATSLFSSYSGCRQYREDIDKAVAEVPNAPGIDKLRQAWNHPGFIDAMTERVSEALAEAPNAPTLFTAHSLPRAMAACSAYEAQLAEACALVAQRAGVERWSLAYQSASSAPVPWLEPDVGAALGKIAEEGAEGVIVAPIGFVCDHMEVAYDLDIEAAETARRLGLRFTRAATVGTHPAYVNMVRDLVLERMTANPERPALGTLGPCADFCAADCCLSGRPSRRPTARLA